MNLKKLRAKFPEYDDIPDGELVHLVHAADYADMTLDEFMGRVQEDDGETPDLVVPALYDIEEAVKALHEAVVAVNGSIKACTPVDTTTPMVDILKQIKTQLSNMEVAIKSIKQPTTPQALTIPEIKVPEIKLPDAPKEWTFDIVRDRNGYIQSVKARA